MKPIKSITWTPNRGKFEPVTKVILARADMYQDFLELFVAYDYDAQTINKFDQLKVKKEHIRSSVLIPKHAIALSRSIAEHQAQGMELTDIDTSMHVVFVHYLNQEEWIYCSQEDQKMIYNELSAWLKSQPSQK